MLQFFSLFYLYGLVEPSVCPVLERSVSCEHLPELVLLAPLAVGQVLGLLVQADHEQGSLHLVNVVAVGGVFAEGLPV